MRAPAYLCKMGFAPLSLRARKTNPHIIDMLLMIHTFSVVLSLQLKKLPRHSKSVINPSNANPGRGHK